MKTRADVVPISSMEPTALAEQWKKVALEEKARREAAETAARLNQETSAGRERAHKEESRRLHHEIGTKNKEITRLTGALAKALADLSDERRQRKALHHQLTDMQDSMASMVVDEISKSETVWSIYERGGDRQLCVCKVITCEGCGGDVRERRAEYEMELGEAR